MKNSPISICIVALVAAAFHLAYSSRVLADDPDSAATLSLLTSGQWKLTKKAGSDVRMFNKDGTFTTLDKKDDTGQWVMTKDFVILIFPNGHKDALDLPLNPKGTDGYTDSGEPITAVLVVPAAPNSAPLVASGTSSPAPGQPEAPAASPSAPASPPIVMSEKEKAATVALLASKRWRFIGGWWYVIRVFDKDGTFTTVDSPGDHGTWVITDRAINLTFPDGHIDAILLPLDPKGTDGLDKDGGYVTVIQCDLPPVVITHVQNSMDAFFHPAPTPHVMTPKELGATATMLVSVPWRFTGRKWTSCRVFDKNGTFATVNKEKETGIWVISDNKIVLTFADGHDDTLSLPLYPAGTEGTDKDGGATIAIQQNFPGFALKRVPQTAGSQLPQAPTPPPLGTRQQ